MLVISICSQTNRAVTQALININKQLTFKPRVTLAVVTVDTINTCAVTTCYIDAIVYVSQAVTAKKASHTLTGIIGDTINTHTTIFTWVS